VSGTFLQISPPPPKPSRSTADIVRDAIGHANGNPARVTGNRGKTASRNTSKGRTRGWLRYIFQPPGQKLRKEASHRDHRGTQPSLRPEPKSPLAKHAKAAKNGGQMPEGRGQREPQPLAIFALFARDITLFLVGTYATGPGLSGNAFQLLRVCSTERSTGGKAGTRDVPTFLVSDLPTFFVSVTSVSSVAETPFSLRAGH
jgi:hypothetical protein